MKSKQEFEKAWGAHKGERYEVGFAVTDALEVMEALEAQIPKARFKVGDRVKCLQGYGGLDVRGIVTSIRPEVEWAYWYTVDGGCEHSAEELAPCIEPPTVEEFYDTFAFVSENGSDAVYDAMEKLCNRYEAWKESQNG